MMLTKDCDKCGSTTEVLEGQTGFDKVWFVECSGCGKEGPDRRTKLDAIRAWNGGEYNNISDLEPELDPDRKSTVRQGKPPVSVMQEWTWNLSFMQQTVLLTAIRGPDGSPKYGPIKMLLRWYRRCVLVSSLDGEVLENPYDTRGGSFMGPSYDIIGSYPWQIEMGNIFSEYLRDLDAIPHHFQLHLMHAFEIVGYKHPYTDIREWFFKAYTRLVKDMHLNIELEEHMDHRLGDNRDDWMATADPATVK